MELKTVILVAGLCALICVSGVRTASADVIDDDLSGLKSSSTSTIEHRIWDDLDRDGFRDSGEPGLSGVSVRLFADPCSNRDGTFAASSVTDTSGGYSFQNLPAGRYCIVVDETTLPPSYTSTAIRSPIDLILGTEKKFSYVELGYVTAFAQDRLTVGAFAPCHDITWLEEYAQKHNANFINIDYRACNFTLHVETYGMAALRHDITHDPMTRQSHMDVFTKAAFVPNDPDFNDSNLVYAPQQINAEGAWDFTTGDAGLIVAVLDSGIDPSHPEFVGRIMPGWDFANGDSEPWDDSGHGTHVTGIVAAGINNNVGMAGIAGTSKILPVKVLSADGTGWWSDVANGITYAVDHGAKVINLSLAGTTDSSTLRDAVDYAIARDVTVVASAGNNNSDLQVYPASYDKVLAMGATTYDGSRWSMSNYGPNIDALAPGGLVWSTFWSPQASPAYQFMSGTSMAAPHATGVAALMYSRNPNLTAQEVRDTILSTAMDMGPPGIDELHGHGLVNALAAVAAVPIQNPSPISPLSVSIVEDLSGNGIADPGDTVRYVVNIVNESGVAWENVVVISGIPENTNYVEGSTKLNGIPVQDNTSAAAQASYPSSVTPFPLDEGGLPIGGLGVDEWTTVSFDVIVNLPPPVFYAIHNETTVLTSLGTQFFTIDTPIGGSPCRLDFTDASGAMTEIFPQNGSIYIFVEDMDENTDANSKQSVEALLLNLSHSDLETINLVETTNDSGVFRGTVPSSSTNVGSENDGTLFAQSGDMIEVTYSDPDFFPDTSNDFANIDGLGTANLQMLMSVDDDTPTEGQEIVYTIEVENDGGPNAATHLAASDLLPNGLTFISAIATQGIYDEVSGFWMVGTLGASSESELTITAVVDDGMAGETITNVATIYYFDQFDPVLANNMSSVSLVVSAADDPADLRILKSVNEEGPHQGDSIVYTVRVLNQGPAIATGVQVRDTLPIGIEFDSSSATQGSYDDDTGIWDVGSIQLGAEAILTINAVVVSNGYGSQITNTATVHHLDQVDVHAQNDMASAAITVSARSSYSLINQLSTSSPVGQHEEVEFSIQVINTGETWVTHLPLQDEYDLAYMRFKNSIPQVDDSTNDGVLNWGDLVASFGYALAPGDSFAISIVFEAIADTTSPWVHPNGATVNTSTVANAQAAMDPNDLSGATVLLPTQSASDEVQILSPTAVTMTDFRTRIRSGNMIVSWRTLSELDIVGFNLLRQHKAGPVKRVNDAIILAKHSGSDEGARYEFFDDTVQAGARYRYQLEAVLADGRVEHFHWPGYITLWQLNLPLLKASIHDQTVVIGDR